MAVSGADSGGPGPDGPATGDGNDEALAGTGAGPAPGIEDTAGAVAARLELGDEDVRLPWLESADDDDDNAGSGVGELVKFAVLGLLALVLIVGTIWWLTRTSPDDDIVADGSTIEVPDTPYKAKPEDPEGKTFDGTGDTSFAVSEGQERPARLGQGGGQGGGKAPVAAPSPGFSSVPKGEGPGARSSAAAPTPAASGIGVQVGAYSTRALAEAGWGKLVQRSDVLSGVSHRIVEGKADIGTVYRLQAVAPDAAAARTLCGRLKSAGVACQVKN